MKHNGTCWVCENPQCEQPLDVDHVTLVTTEHVRRFCDVGCLVTSYELSLDCVMEEEIECEGGITLTNEYRDVSPSVDSALRQIVDAIKVLETEHPIIEESAESFIGTLMNVFPGTKSGFKVNPHPVLAVEEIVEYKTSYGLPKDRNTGRIQ